MAKNEMVRKTVYIPARLCLELEIASRESGTSFSVIVTERLENGMTLTVSEGRQLCRLLFEIRRHISENNCESIVTQKIIETTDQIVDTLLEIHEKYLTGGNQDGNCKSR